MNNNETSPLVKQARQAAGQRWQKLKPEVLAFQNAAVADEAGRNRRAEVLDMATRCLPDRDTNVSLLFASYNASSEAAGDALNAGVHQVELAALEATVRIEELESLLARAGTSLAEWETIRDWLIENNGGGSMGHPQELVLSLLKRGAADARRLASCTASRDKDNAAWGEVSDWTYENSFRLLDESSHQCALRLLKQGKLSSERIANLEHRLIEAGMEPAPASARADYVPGVVLQQILQQAGIAAG